MCSRRDSVWSFIRRGETVSGVNAGRTPRYRPRGDPMDRGVLTRHCVDRRTGMPPEGGGYPIWIKLLDLRRVRGAAVRRASASAEMDARSARRWNSRCRLRIGQSSRRMPASSRHAGARRRDSRRADERGTIPTCRPTAATSSRRCGWVLIPIAERLGWLGAQESRPRPNDCGGVTFSGRAIRE